MIARAGYCKWRVGRKLFATRAEAVAWRQAVGTLKPATPHIRPAHKGRVVSKAKMAASW